jgi:hypothetical protein
MQMAQDFAVGIRTTLVSSNDGAGLSRAAEVIAIKKSLEARGPQAFRSLDKPARPRDTPRAAGTRSPPSIGGGLSSAAAEARAGGACQRWRDVPRPPRCGVFLRPRMRLSKPRTQYSRADAQLGGELVTAQRIIRHQLGRHYVDRHPLYFDRRPKMSSDDPPRPQPPGAVAWCPLLHAAASGQSRAPRSAGVAQSAGDAVDGEEADAREPAVVGLSVLAAPAQHFDLDE